MIDNLLFLGFAAFGPAVSLSPATDPIDFTGIFNFAAIDFDLLGLSLNLATLAALPSVFFEITVDSQTSNSITGSFFLETFLSDGLISAAGVGVPPQSASFSAVVTLAPVPVPAALPLAITGAAVLGGLGWRKRRKAAALT